MAIGQVSTKTPVVGSNIKDPKALNSAQLKQLSTNVNPDAGATTSLQELAPDIMSSPPVNNQATNVNNAAYAVALSPTGTDGQTMIDNYRQALTEVGTTGTSPTAINLLGNAVDSNKKANSDSLMGLLADPNVPDSVKQEAVGKVYDTGSYLYNPANMLSNKAANTPTTGIPNQEQDSTGVDTASIFDRVNNEKREQQKIYNAAVAQNNPDTLGKIFDFGLTMMPFVKQTVLAKTMSDVSDAPVKAFVKTFIGGVGNAKQWAIDSINTLPPDQRLDAAQKMADLINSHAGILGDGGVADTARKDLLTGILGGQGYSSGEKIGDNLASWLDLAVVGGAAVGAIKNASRFAKAAQAGASEAEVASAFKADFEQNYKALTQGVPNLDIGIQPGTIRPGGGGELKTFPETYQKVNKNSEGQFQRSREVQVYDSSTGVPYQKMPEENVLSSAIRDAIRNGIQPSSVYNNVKDFNPDMARDSFESMRLDDTGDAAQAIAGTTRTDALAGPMLPEVAHTDGSVVNKVYTPDAINISKDVVPDGVFDIINHDGMTQYQQSEKAAARSWKQNQFGDAVGMTPRGEMFQILPDMTRFTQTPQGFVFRGVYGPQNNGFTNASDALEVAKFALRNTGIDETKLGLMRRDGAKYVPTTLDEIHSMKEAATQWAPATTGTGEVNASAVGKGGYEFGLTDQPTTMDTSGYGLKDGQWIREIVAKDKDTGEQIGRLIYTNYDRAPSIRVYPNAQRKGVATAMLKMARNQGGVLGEDQTGKFASGEQASRTEEGQAFRSKNKPESVKVFKDDSIPNDYLVSVDHDYRMSSQDVQKAHEDPNINGGWNQLNVKMNFFDRYVPMGGTQGTFSNILFDHASMLDPTIVQSAVVGTDRASRIERIMVNKAGDWAKKYTALSHAQRDAVHFELTEANLKGRDHNYTQMAAKGMSAEAMDVVKDFRNFQDGAWYLRNIQHNDMLAKQGFEELVHSASGTNLPVRKVPKSNVAGGVNVWNPQTDAIENIKSADLETLYKNGGGIAKFRRPVINANGDAGEYVKYTNNPADSYLRTFNANSRTLAYRPGYYPIVHKDPFYVVERVRDNKGNVIYDHAVSKAADTKSAKLMASRLQAQNGNPHYFRRDTKLMSGDRDMFDMDLNQSHGQSAFRQRGKLLEDTTSNITNMAQANIENPMETMISQARRLSRQISMQDVIDATRQRAVAQYGQFLDKDEFHRPVVPRDMRQIKYRGGTDQNQSDVADARTSFGYVNYLENGYVNLLDDGIKRVLQETASLFGELKYGAPLEKGLMTLSQKSLTNGLRSLTYYAYMGTNPLRQLVIQGHQATLTAVLNPKWAASQKVFSQPMYMTLRTLGIDPSKPGMAQLAIAAFGDLATAERVFEQFGRAGVSAAVDHQTMISGAVNDVSANMLAKYETDVLGMVKKPVHMIAGAMRKIGFDSGEFFNSMMSWLAHRDLAEQAGKDVFNDEVIDQVTGMARNWTGNMNLAGEMAYNRNALGNVFQYQQNSHKLLLNLTTNRAIPPAIKVRMAIYSLMMFGTGMAAVFNTPLNNVKDPNAREALTYGLEGWMLNKSLTLASGQKSEIDWSGLSPYNSYGTLDLIHNIFTTSIGETLANTPSGSMFFGSNPRVANAAKDMARYTHLVDDFEKPTDLLTAAKDFAKISSGYSAYFKTKYMLELNKKISAAGKVTDNDVAAINAIGTAMGFPTLKESTMNYLNQDAFAKEKAVKDDVTQWYKDLKQHYLDESLTGNRLLYTQRMLNEFNRVYGDDQAAQRVFNGLIMRDIKNGDASIYNVVLRNCELYNKGSCQDLIKAAPFNSEQERQNMLDLINWGDSYKAKDYDEGK